MSLSSRPYVLAAALLAAVSCGESHATSTGPATTGTIVGAVTSSLGGSLTGVHIVVTPLGGTALPAVTTSSAGGFVATGVPVASGDGAIAISALPNNCAATATNYTGLTGNDTLTVNVTVTCTALVGAVKGTITSSLGAALSGVGVIVTPHGRAALPAMLTSSGGAYLAANVPIADSTGSVTLTNLPPTCQIPSAVNYTGLAFGDTVTVNVTVTCTTAAGLITGTVSSGLGATAGVSVIATPRGGSALPAVTTNSSGAYTLSGVPAGDGAITVSGLPAWCTTPGATSYAGVTTGDTIDINVTVSCVAPTGTVSGAVTSSLGGNLVGVGVVVTPTGGTALPAVVTSNTGTYTVHGVPVGGGSVTLTSGLPATCPTPSATPYTGVQYAGTVTTNVGVSCVVGGTLAVTVDKLPLGASVFATGPNGYSQSFTGNTLLNGLLPGSYTVTPVPAIYHPYDSVVSPVYLPTVTGSPATVVSNATDTAKVAFPHNGTGYLYMGWGNAAFAPFTSPELRTGATSPTNAIIAIPGSTANQLAAIAIDAQGTIWTAVSFDPNLHGTTGARFDSGSVSASDITIPNVVPSGRTIKSMAFDVGGNLWFVSATHLAALTPAQLVARDASSPAYTITIPFYSIVSMAFDAGGNLWIVGFGATGNQILEYTASQLTAGGTPTPKTMTLTAPILGCIAFDTNGVMWLCDQTYTGGIVGYTPSQLAAGDTLPAYRIPFDSTRAALSLAFDAIGNLWVQEFTTSSTYPLIEYLGSSLTSGSPAVMRSTVMTSPTAVMAFDPTPAGLPIYGSRVRPRAPTVRSTGTRRR